MKLLACSLSACSVLATIICIVTFSCKTNNSRGENPMCSNCTIELIFLFCVGRRSFLRRTLDELYDIYMMCFSKCVFSRPRGMLCRLKTRGGWFVNCVHKGGRYYYYTHTHTLHACVHSQTLRPVCLPERVHIGTLHTHKRMYINYLVFCTGRRVYARIITPVGAKI